jgi:hypothetical protein
MRLLGGRTVPHLGGGNPTAEIANEEQHLGIMTQGMTKYRRTPGDSVSIATNDGGGM